MTRFDVAHWGQPVPLSDGTCHCGKPIKYSLPDGLITHADSAVNATCTEPWPDAPAPEWYAASRALTAAIRGGSEALDRVFGIETPSTRSGSSE